LFGDILKEKGSSVIEHLLIVFEQPILLLPALIVLPANTEPSLTVGLRS
jgi:hypothetical protein